MGFGYESHQSYPLNANEKVLLLIHLLKCFVHKNVILWPRAGVGLPQSSFSLSTWSSESLHLLPCDFILSVILLLQNGIQIELYNSS